MVSNKGSAPNLLRNQPAEMPESVLPALLRVPEEAARKSPGCLDACHKPCRAQHSSRIPATAHELSQALLKRQKWQAAHL